MKKKIFFFLILIPGFAFAQNYQNICSQGTTFFRNPDSSFGAFRRDSANAVGNGDTTFISYRAIRGLSMGCYDTNAGSTLGRKIIRTSSGMFIFFNKNYDTIRINTQASTGQSWIFCQLSNGEYIEATVASITPSQVLGQPDNIKIITLQAKNASGINISHLYNGKTIELSQNYGLTKIFDIYFVPNDTIPRILAGKSFPELGVQNLTLREIYDFQVGDEFHYRGDGIPYWANFNKIEKILDRIDTGDSIHYICERCEILDDGTYQGHDTVELIYNINDTNSNWIFYLPDEFVRKGYIADDYYYSDDSYGLRRTKGIVTRYFEFNPQSNCWTNPGYYQGTINTSKYSEGLGRTYYKETAFYPTFFRTENLVYYHKQNQKWGTPLATDCWTLLPVSEKEKEQSFSLFPNPVYSTLIIQFPTASSHEIIIYNSIGRKVFSTYTYETKIVVDCSDFAKDLYICTIRTEDQIFSKKFLKN